MHVLKHLGAALLILVSSLAAAQQADSYKLAPGDQVTISVYQEADLSMEFTLSDDGKLNYPFLGDIQISGLTMPELQTRIADGLRGPCLPPEQNCGYLINPDVTVAMKEYRQFFINGEVKSPGGYPYQPGLTLEKALALAGGLSPRAAKSKIEVKRAGDSSGATEKIRMSDPVNAGDVITVPQSFF